MLLFDVDGTLVLTGGAAVRAMDEAFHEVFGIRGAFEHVPMPGRTDGAILKDAFTRAIPQSQILADALAATGVHPVDGEIARYKASYFARFAEEIHKPVPVDPERPAKHRFKGVLPGVREVLHALDGRPDVFLGLLTGNYEQGARIKLEYFDLWRHFRCGAYGDDSLDRHALVPVAVERSRRAGCPEVEPARCRHHRRHAARCRLRARRGRQLPGRRHRRLQRGRAARRRRRHGLRVAGGYRRGRRALIASGE